MLGTFFLSQAPLLCRRICQTKSCHVDQKRRGADVFCNLNKVSVLELSGYFFLGIMIIKPFIVFSIVLVASGYVPKDEASRLRDADQLREAQRRYQALLQSLFATR